MTELRGIIAATVRLVFFFTADLEADLTYNGVETVILTVVEPSAYFICSCLPGTRPLLRATYNRLGLGPWMKDRYGTRQRSKFSAGSSGTDAASAGGGGGGLGIALGNTGGRHIASVSTKGLIGRDSSRARGRGGSDGGGGGYYADERGHQFIRLDETVAVDHESGRSSTQGGRSFLS